MLAALAACTSHAEEPLVVEDKFDTYVGGSAGSPTWQPLTKDWAVRNGVLEAVEPLRTGTVTWLPGQVFGDVRVDVRFKILNEGGGVRAPGIVLASQDSTRYYYVHYASQHSQVILVRVDPGKPWNELKRVPGVTIEPEVWHQARFELAGGHLAAYLDGRLFAEADDSTYKAGAIGLRAGQGHILFDDLRVEGTRGQLEKEWQLMPEPNPHNDLDCKRLTGAERAIATKGQGYFPVLTKLRDGSIAAVVRGGAPHIGIGGRLDFIRSTDGGKTWAEPTVIVDSKWDDRNPAFGQMPDGTIVCAYAEAQTYNEKGEWDTKAGEYLHFYVTSADNGKTWSEKQKLFAGPIRGGSPYGKIVVTDDGTALLSVYGGADPEWTGEPRVPEGATKLVGIVRSRDNGRTWSDFSFVSTRDHNETALLALTSEHLLAAARTYSLGNVALLESHNGGRTWTDPKPVTEKSQHPADLIRLADGKLLLTYGNRREPLGCGAILSADSGRTWDYAHRAMVGWTCVSGDCGYPSSVQLDDGTIVTLYYSVGLSDVEGHEFAVGVRYTETMVGP
jgi:hypothetical protein